MINGLRPSAKLDRASDWVSETRNGNLTQSSGVWIGMRREWTLRQVLATVRGIGFMVGLFWVFMALQFVPPLVRSGFSGAWMHLVQVATAGVPEARWPMAVARMQEALAVMAALAVLLFLLQKYLARKLKHEPSSLKP